MSGYWEKQPKRLDGRRSKGKLTKGQQRRIQDRLNRDRDVEWDFILTLEKLGLYEYKAADDTTFVRWGVLPLV